MIALLFDIDGTLLYSHGTGKRAFSRAFQEQFNISSEGAFPDAHGKTDPAIADEIALILLGRKLTDEELDRLNHRYTELFADEIAAAKGFEILPGVTTLIPHLASMPDLLLGIQTGNLRTPAYQKLSRAGIAEYFSFGGFASDSRDRPQLVAVAIERAKARAAELGRELSAVVVIGDTVRDLDAAVASGAQFIGVGTGGRSGELAGRIPPASLLPDLSDHGLFLDLLPRI